MDNALEEELDRLLSIVVDIENLYFVVNREEDTDTKQVISNIYFFYAGYLFQ